MIHGNPARVASGCTCNLCTLVRETQPRRKPTITSVPARPVAAHIAALIAADWTYKGLARHVGYHPSTLRGIATGRVLFTSRWIAEDILSVPIEAPTRSVA